MVMGLVSKARDIRIGAGEASFPILYKMFDSDKNRDIYRYQHASPAQRSCVYLAPYRFYIFYMKY